MKDENLKLAFELADESVNGGFADKGSFEYTLGEALLEMKKKYETDTTMLMKRLERALETPHEDAVRVKPWEFNMMSQGRENIVGRPIAWSQWPNEENT